MKILIADESILICSLIIDLLKKNNLNHEIFECNSTNSVLIFIKKYHPDLIIIDISGIELNGARIIESLKQKDKLSKIIFISQFDDLEFKNKAKELNGIFLNKSELETLPKLMESFL